MKTKIQSSMSGVVAQHKLVALEPCLESNRHLTESSCGTVHTKYFGIELDIGPKASAYAAALYYGCDPTAKLLQQPSFAHPQQILPVQILAGNGCISAVGF